MKWASAIAEGPDIKANVEECASSVSRELGNGEPASLVVVFVAATYGDASTQVPHLLQEYFPNAVILGCSGAGVIGNGQEIEDRPAVALTAGHLPGVRITAFHTSPDTLPSPDDPPDAWVRLVGVTPEERPDFLILMDPFSAPGEDLLKGLDFAFPASAKVGGIASGGMNPGTLNLYLDNETYYQGAVGVTLSGDIAVDTIVAQGCRSIGEPRRITKCQRNVLLELDGEPPLAYLQAMFHNLPPRDQDLVKHNLFLGIAMDPLLTLEDVPSGHYLIRNLIGADQNSGSLAVGELLREGQLVQFHVRDAMTSTEDLQSQLMRYLEDKKNRAVGALLFQCTGRGMHLYGKPNHDTDVFNELVGSLPIGGFFCNGEIGPVSGYTYLHGYTSSFAIFSKP
jgi:small ligand-binding sensory domain FIST